MGRIVLATAGSLGDLHPYIAVGLGLKARGHDVTVATAAFYRANVEAAGLRFHVLRPDISPGTYTPEVFRRANDLRDGTRYLLKELVLPAAEQTYQDLMNACRGADLMVSHPVLFPAPVVAEKLGIRWISVVLAPGAFMSAYDPPVLPPFPWVHALRHFGPLPTAVMFRFFSRVTRGWMKPIDELRSTAGLPPTPKNPIHAGMFSPLGTLGWFSGALASPQPDWPVRARATGFPFYDNLPSRGEMEPSRAQFLACGEPPVVFTLGSSAVMHPGDFFEESLEASRRIGCRAVVLVGSTSRIAPASVPRTIFVSDYARYSELFPKASVVVHQGGIGTAGQVLRAGVPSLVVPFMHDQPDNAFRLRRLGVARVLSRVRYNADRAARIVAELLGNHSYAMNAKRLAQRIQQEDGVGSACAALEQHAASA